MAGEAARPSAEGARLVGDEALLVREKAGSAREGACPAAEEAHLVGEAARSAREGVHLADEGSRPSTRDSRDGVTGSGQPADRGRRTEDGGGTANRSIEASAGSIRVTRSRTTPG